MFGPFNRNKTLLLSISGAFVALTAIATTSYAGSNDKPVPTMPVPCEVVSSTSGSSTSLEAIYNAQGPVSGSYRFSVRSVGGAGSTNINQGGGFSAQSAGPISLGRVTVSSAPRYDIALTVEIAGETFVCLSDGR